MLNKLILILLVVSLLINWMQFWKMQELKQEQLYNDICIQECIN